MSEDEKRFLAYGFLKTEKEIDEVKKSNISAGLRDRLADTWSITGETYSKDLLVGFILDEQDKRCSGLTEAEVIRRGISAAYSFIRNMRYGYEELEKEFKE